jgi:hypothetical protein
LSACSFGLFFGSHKINFRKSTISHIPEKRPTLVKRTIESLPPEVWRFVFGKVSHSLLPNQDGCVLTTVHWQLSTGDVQPVENGRLTGSSKVR